MWLNGKTGTRRASKRSVAAMRRPEGPDAHPAEQEILVHDEGRVRIVTLNRPDRINAFTARSYRRLAGALDEADAATDVSVVLLQGAGRGFSSGVDLAVVGSLDESLGEDFDHLINSLIRFSKPLLAAVHGAAVGFGATILLHCDLTLVAETGAPPAAFYGTRYDPGSGQQRLTDTDRRGAARRRPHPDIAMDQWNGSGTDGARCSMLSGGIRSFRGGGDRSGPRVAARRSRRRGQAPFEGWDSGPCPRRPPSGA